MLITSAKDLDDFLSSDNIENIIIKGDSALHKYARNILKIQSIKSTVFVKGKRMGCIYTNIE